MDKLPWKSILAGCATLALMIAAVAIGAAILVSINPAERLNKFIAPSYPNTYPKDKLGYMEAYRTVVTMTSEALTSLDFTDETTWRPTAEKVESAIKIAQRIAPPQDAILEQGLHYVTVANLQCARQNLALAERSSKASGEQRKIIARYAMICLRRALQAGEILVEK